MDTSRKNLTFRDIFWSGRIFGQLQADYLDITNIFKMATETNCSFLRWKYLGNQDNLGFWNVSTKKTMESILFCQKILTKICTEWKNYWLHSTSTVTQETLSKDFFSKNLRKKQVWKICPNGTFFRQNLWILKKPQPLVLNKMTAAWDTIMVV